MQEAELSMQRLDQGASEESLLIKQSKSCGRTRMTLDGIDSGTMYDARLILRTCQAQWREM